MQILSSNNYATEFECETRSKVGRNYDSLTSSWCNPLQRRAYVRPASRLRYTRTQGYTPDVELGLSTNYYAIGPIFSQYGPNKLVQ